MSAPSFSSFSPAFSSFPDLEEGPSSSKSRRKGSPEERDTSRRHHKQRDRERRSRRDEHEREDDRSLQRHKGRKGRIYQSDHDETTRRSLGRTTSDLTDSPVYFKDSKGDTLNLTYGTLHTGSIPRYYTVSGGRRVLGLSRGLNVVSNTGKEVVVAARDTHKVPQLTDAKTRSLLAASKPRRFVVNKKLASQYEEVDGFIRISQREEGILPREVSSDSDESTSTRSQSPDPDEDVYTLSSREELLRDLEQRVQRDPKDVEAWLEIIAQSLHEPQTSANNKSHAEIETTVLSRAFKAHPDNTRSFPLWIKYLVACERIWTDEKVSAAWAEAILKADCPDLTVAWLDWRLRRSASNLETTLRDAATVFNKKWKGISESDEDRANLRLFWRVAVFLQQAGYNERAYALFQAEAQLLRNNFQQTMPWEKHMDELEIFWDSEGPRIGDVEVVDHSSSDSHDGSDVFTRWAYHEDACDRRFIPRRTEDDDDDPYSTVLFTDIRPFLVNIRTKHGSHLFRQIWMYYLGLRTPGLLASMSMGISDAAWAETSFCLKSFMNELFPQQSSDHHTSESVAGALVGRERVYRDSFGIVREWGSMLLGSVEAIRPDGRVRCWEKFSGPVDVIRNIFADLRDDENDIGWDEQSLAFELATEPKRGTRRLKQLLSQNDRSVQLWAVYARFFRVLGKAEEARKVYEKVLPLLSGETDECNILWWDYAEMLWYNGQNEEAQDVFLRWCGQTIGSGTLGTLRSKRRLEELIEDSKADISKRRITLCLLRARLLLEILTASALHSTLEIGRRYIRETEGNSWLQEGVTMTLLVLVYHHIITLRNPAAMELLRELAHTAIKRWPDNTVVLGVLLESEKGEAVWGRVRRSLADTRLPESGKSVVRRISEIWVSSWVIGRWFGEVERVRAILEAAIVETGTRGPVLWRIFVEFELRFGRMEQAKSTLLRALGDCPFYKELYLIAFGPLRKAFKARELALLAETMAEKGLRLRGSIEELIDLGGFDDPKPKESLGDEEEDEIVERAKELRRLMPY